jgi:hypothetical protein
VNVWGSRDAIPDRQSSLSATASRLVLGPSQPRSRWVWQAASSEIRRPERRGHRTPKYRILWAVLSVFLIMFM